ncbi:hypothetical protein PsyrH_20180 [Pseudomonas syringae pv. syringae HS191]|nr:hypothetical protein PsyrH_20180 [Pseudomonas syringae pv. syringae HS191]
MPHENDAQPVIPSAIYNPNETRYRYLRKLSLDAISIGGVFVGKTPDNVVLNLEDVYIAIDIALAEATQQLH